MTILCPDFVWLDGRFRRRMAVVVDAETGRITALEEADGTAGGGDAGGGSSSVEGGGIGDVARAERVELPGRALLPGFVNAHSHAFQRLIRGRTQTRPAGSDGADFWSWREAMYGAALGLSPDDLYHVSRFCFLEMLRTGITAVGEFHYLHHQPDGTPYRDPNELALRVITAAEDVGLRIALLEVCYAAGGIGEPLEDRQRRFRAASAGEYLERAERLHSVVTAAGGVHEPGSGLASVGVAPHSIRAVPRRWLPALRDWAAERGLPLHMHVAEVPAEVAACEQAFGLRPVELLAEDGLLDSRFTAVHATHLTEREVELLGESGATVCACPTTERDLGDGFLPGLELRRAGVPIALGTDSHTNLDFLEEMRLIEYHERLQRNQRIVVTDRGDGGEHLVAPALLGMATAAGAGSLGLDAGAIEPGRLADLAAVDLGHPSLAGWRPDTLAPMITLSATPDIVTDVWVGGVRRLADRDHAAAAEVEREFRRVAAAGP